jgi:hypothetical protein
VFYCTGTYLETTLLQKYYNPKPIAPIVLQIASDHPWAEIMPETMPNRTTAIYFRFREINGDLRGMKRMHIEQDVESSHKFQNAK